MKNSLLGPGIGLIARFLVGGVLLYAGFSKAVAPAAEFAAALTNYHLFPPVLLTPVAYALPWIEIWTGLFLMTGLYTPYVAGVSVALFTVFLGVLTSARMRHIDLASCGCFGAETFSPATTLKMDSVLLVIAICVLLFYRRPRALTLDRY